jgi:hypothetical protein
MARSQASATKKEKEKKKLQKRQDKEQRKQERKANSMEGKPLEEMMAYVDIRTAGSVQEKKYQY